MEREIICGDALEVLRGLPDQSIHCCVTSPPYWGLRDYGVEGQLGLEKAPEEYVERLVGIFKEVRRVLRDDGTLWLNLGDSYASSPASGGSKSSGLNAKRADDGSLADDNKSQGITPTAKYTRPPGLKPKDLIGIPWRVAFALQADGWWLRSDIIWAKPNPMPESVRDRPTKAHEYIFLLSKNAQYFYDADAIREPMTSDGKGGLWGADRSSGATADEYHIGAHGKEPWTGERNVNSNGRNKRTVWTVTTKPFKEAHFAVFPPDLIRPCVLAGCPPGGTVLDPFFGAGTAGLVAKQEGRGYIGIDLNAEYVEMARRRIWRECPMEKLI